MKILVMSNDPPRPGGLALDSSQVTVKSEDGESICSTRLGLEINAGDFVKLRITEHQKETYEVHEYFVEKLLIITREDLECIQEKIPNIYKEHLATFHVNKKHLEENKSEAIISLFSKAMESSKGHKPENLSIEQQEDNNGFPVEENGMLVFHLYAK